MANAGGRVKGGGKRRGNNNQGDEDQRHNRRGGNGQGNKRQRDDPETDASPAPSTGPAFLLAQLGSHAATVFATRIAELDLTPPQAGFLRAVSARPGISQQALAGLLGTPPSRLVGLVDDMEARDLVQRRRNPADRRQTALYLTEPGVKLLGRLATLARAHDEAMCRALEPEERDQLRGLLQRIADQQELTAGVHPGFRRIGRSAVNLGGPNAR